MNTMDCEEARSKVSAGLQRRKEAKEAARQEARLEAYEREMIAACNGNCADARKLRLADEADRYSKAQLVAQRKEAREQLQREWERDSQACAAMKQYLVGCMGLMLVTVWTPLPWWAAAALIFGTAVFLSAYIFRLFFPMHREGEG